MDEQSTRDNDSGSNTQEGRRPGDAADQASTGHEPAPQEDLVCAVCGHPIGQDDLICPNCGVSLAAG